MIIKFLVSMTSIINERADIIFSSFCLGIVVATVFVCLVHCLCSFRRFKKSISHREWLLLFCFVLLSVMVFDFTIFSRNKSIDPYCDMIGHLTLISFDDGKIQSINKNAVENIILFIPHSLLLNEYFYAKNRKYSIAHYAVYGGLVSFSIELLQGVFRRGTFQLSDIFFNSLGSVIGYIIYGSFRRYNSFNLSRREISHEFGKNRKRLERK